MEIDAGRPIDWGRTSEDYARHRPGPPPSFYARLDALGVGLPGQRVLDLGTGTGVVARSLAARGCRVAGVDLSAEQIAMARRLAEGAGLALDLRVAPSEALPFEPGSFDVVSANQCWFYFDRERVLGELRRVLRPGGSLVVSYFSFLPREDPLVRASEQLVLRFNPDWEGADWDGRPPPAPASADQGFPLRARFVYDEAIPFTRESWRGRMRALRAIGASLAAEEVERFDAEHAALLAARGAERFPVQHRILAHVCEHRGGGAREP